MNHNTDNLLAACGRVIWGLAMLSATILFGVISWCVWHAQGSLSWDLFWSQAINALRCEPLTGAMLAVHAVNGKLVAGVIVLLLVVSAARRQPGPLLRLLAAVPGGMLLNLGVKLLVHRARPLLPADVGSHGYAFPSGHTLAITLLSAYLLLATFRRTPRLRWRVAASLAAMVTVVLVAFSRVYLGVHHPTDVAAAVLLGVVWMGLCGATSEALGLRQVGARVSATVSSAVVASSTTR